MDIHVYYAGLIVFGLICLLTAALIWAFFVATDPQFASVVERNNKADISFGCWNGCPRLEGGDFTCPICSGIGDGEIIHREHGREHPVQADLTRQQQDVSAPVANWSAKADIEVNPSIASN